MTFEDYKKEAEMFFVTELKLGPTAKEIIVHSLDCIFNNTGNTDNTKGIVAWDPKYGQGKTFFFDVVNHYYRRNYGRYLFVHTTAKDLCHLYTSTEKGIDAEKRLEKFIKVKRLFIDDIGEELKEGAVRYHYKNSLNVIRFVLLKRYEWWIKNDWQTWGTSNLDIEEIGKPKNYGGRVADRLEEMCHLIQFDLLTKGSYRQMKSTRKLTLQEKKDAWKKLKKPTEPEEINYKKYFNELIGDEKYLEIKASDWQYWNFIGSKLVEMKLIKKANVTPTRLKKAKEILFREKEASKSKGLKHWAKVEKVSLEDLEQFSDDHAEKVASGIVYKDEFYKLKKNNHEF